MEQSDSGRTRFLLKNMLTGLIWLAGIILLFYYFKQITGVDFQALIDKHADRPMLILSIFLLSEVVFGIIPPEIFMIWAAGSEDFASYPLIMAMLASISYAAGIVGYFFGRHLHGSRAYAYLERGILRSYIPVLKRYGFFLIIVAALTPVPFSAICILVGAVQYPMQRFLLFSSFRFLRFTAYAWIIHHVSGIWFFI